MRRNNVWNNDQIGGEKENPEISLSNDTIRRQIDKMAANVCQQDCSEIKQSTLQASIQLDESTGSALESHLIAFAWYQKDREIKEKFLFSNTLSDTTTAADVKVLLFLKPTSSAGRISSTSVLTVPQRWLASNEGLSHWRRRNALMWRLHTVHYTDTLQHQRLYLYIWWKLWTLRSKWSTSFIPEQNITGSSNFWPKKWERNMWDFCFMPKPVGCWQANASLGCMNLKMRLKFSSRKQNNLHVQFHNEEFVVMLAYLTSVFGHLNDMNLLLQDWCDHQRR